MKTTKEQREKFNQYILSCIDPSSYDLECQTDLEKLKFIWTTFMSEYGPEMIKYYMGEQKAFTEWLKGLPSSFNIDYENYKILEICDKELGVMPLRAHLEGKQLDNYEQKFLTQWFDRVYMAFRGMLRRAEQQKPKPVRKTKDEYQVQGNYGHGWEMVTAEDSRNEARQRLKEYIENETGTAFRIKKVRTRV